jgi:hypothetical protein
MMIHFIAIYCPSKSPRLRRAGVLTFADRKSKALGALRHLPLRPDKIRSFFHTKSTLFAA